MEAELEEARQEWARVLSKLPQADVARHLGITRQAVAHRIKADVVRLHADADNVPSIRVAEKVGMQLVERFEHREGQQVWHGVRYEVLREDR